MRECGHGSIITMSCAVARRPTALSPVGNTAAKAGIDCSPRLLRCKPDPLTGAISMPDGDHSSIDIVRDVARAAGGPVYVFYAPFTVPDAATAHALRQQPEVVRAFGQLTHVTKAVVEVGLWASGQSTLYDTAKEHDRHCVGSGCAPRCSVSSSPPMASRC